MTKPQIKEYNCKTGIETIRDATDAEMAQMAKDKAEADARNAEAEAKATAKAELLVRLGLSEAEAKLLLA